VWYTGGRIGGSLANVWAGTSMIHKRLTWSFFLKNSTRLKTSTSFYTRHSRSRLAVMLQPLQPTKESNSASNHPTCSTNTALIGPRTLSLFSSTASVSLISIKRSMFLQLQGKSFFPTGQTETLAGLPVHPLKTQRWWLATSKPISTPRIPTDRRPINLGARMPLLQTPFASSQISWCLHEAMSPLNKRESHISFREILPQTRSRVNWSMVLRLVLGLV